MAPVLPRLGVGDVQLDLHALERGERVGERERVVGERAGVDDDRRAPAARAVDRRRRGRPRGSTARARARSRGRRRSRWPARQVVERGRCRRSRVRARRAGSGSVPTAGGWSAWARSSASHTGRHADRGEGDVERARGRGRATVSRPIGPGSTKVSPPTDFLSRRIEREQRLGASAGPGTAVGRPSADDHVAVAVDGVGVDPLSAPASAPANTRPTATASPCSSS